VGIREIIDEFKTLLRMEKYLIRISLRYPLNMIAGFIELFLWVLIFFFAMLLFQSPDTVGPGGAPVAAFTAWGFFIYIIINDVMWSMSGGLRYDQVTGVLEQNFLSPISEYTYPIARLFRVFIIDVPFLVFLIVAFHVITGAVVINNPILALYILAISVIGFIGFGFLYAGLILHMKKAAIATNIIQFIMMIFCAVFFPFSALPSNILLISKLIPFSYYVDAFRTTIIGVNPELLTEYTNFLGIELSPIMQELIIIHMITIIFLIIGIKTFKKYITKAKKEGTLHSY